MRPPAGNHNLFDRSLADAARFAFAAINAMLDLEEALFAVGVHIVRDR